MSGQIFGNDAFSTLAGPITNIATSLTLQAGAGALFPNPSPGQYFVITMIPASSGIPGEIMWCTARSVDTLTVLRAQEGTMGTGYLAGDTVSHQVTAGLLSNFGQIVVYAGNPNGNVGGSAGTATTGPTLAWNSTDGTMWFCSASGPAASAVWQFFAPQRTLAGPTQRLGASINTAASTVTFTADEVGVAVTLGGIGTTLANLNASLDISSGTGPGHMDFGTAPLNGFVSVYVTYNPATGLVALLGTSLSQATIYGGGHMPAGYTMSALVSILPTNSNAGHQFSPGNVVDRDFYYQTPTQVLSGGTATSATAVSLSTVVPVVARAVFCNFYGEESSVVDSNSYSYFGPTSAGVQQIQVEANFLGGFNSFPSWMPLPVSQQMFYLSKKSTVISAAGANGYKI